jgi:nicotinamidase-related amidase
VVITGIQTNYCCETTARMAGNLGFETIFAIDATATFPKETEYGVLSADELYRATAINLDGEFAQVLTTQQVLDSL